MVGQRDGPLGELVEHHEGLDGGHELVQALGAAAGLAVGRAMIRDFPKAYAFNSIKEYTVNGIRQHNRNGLLWRDSDRKSVV